MHYLYVILFRYYCVVYPLEKKITMFKGKLMIFYVWFHAAIICLPVVFVNKIIKDDDGKKYCFEQWTSVTAARAYLVCYTLFTILCPLVVTCVAYIFVWIAFKSSQKKVKIVSCRKNRHTSNPASKTELRLLKMLFFMVSCFVVLWAPYVIFRFLVHLRKTEPLSDYFILAGTWVCKVQPVLDPLIYGYLNKQFKRNLCDICRMWTIQCTCPSDVTEGALSSYYGEDLDSSISERPIDQQPLKREPSDSQIIPVLKPESKFSTALKSLNESEVYTIHPRIEHQTSLHMFPALESETIMEWKDIDDSTSLPARRRKRTPYLQNRKRSEKDITSGRLNEDEYLRTIPSASKIISRKHISEHIGRHSHHISSSHIPNHFQYKSTQSGNILEPVNKTITGTTTATDNTMTYIHEKQTFQCETLLLSGLRHPVGHLPPLITTTTSTKGRKKKKILHKRILRANNKVQGFI